LLDQPGVPEEIHCGALGDLKRVNSICRTGSIAWKMLAPLAQSADSRPLEVLDLACGGGDVLLDLRRRAAKAGVALKLTGFDMSSTAIDYARRCASPAQSESSRTEIDYQVCNVFGDFPDRRFDVVMCSLFLHHLDEERAVALLKIMSRAARKLVFVNDLIRCGWGYAAAQVVLRLMTRNHIVLSDGPQSVAGAFTLSEVRQLVRKAGVADASLRKIWPYRFLLSWTPPARAPSEAEGDDASLALH
jgi:2-polyprenyl-3-methyl-5-hydroxy-6-metoxy-1,4-benzoquinol methylase